MWKDDILRNLEYHCNDEEILLGNETIGITSVDEKNA